MIRKITRKAKKIVKRYFESVDAVVKNFELKKTVIGNQLNALLTQMKQTEKPLKRESFSKEFNQLNYDNFLVQSEALKKKQEVEAKRKVEVKKQKEQKIEIGRRFEYVRDFLNQNQLIEIENIIGRTIDMKIFDTSANEWDKENAKLVTRMKPFSHFLFWIETVDNHQFGFCIQNAFVEYGKSIFDSHSFLFKIENNSLQRFMIKDGSNALKI